MVDNVILECPFCSKKTISAVYIPPMTDAHTTRTSAGAKTKFYQTKEKYEIQSGCSNCGKSQKEVQKALKEGISDVDKEKKIFERLKAQGIVKDEMTTKV
ncbi:MAG: hypothetical protein NTW30_03470 [Candidatus Aenigmarchaeota archaeon]|nr:hypothetical protein [Candidatus Aenigmarchaeota archaeon]